MLYVGKCEGQPSGCPLLFIHDTITSRGDCMYQFMKRALIVVLILIAIVGVTLIIVKSRNNARRAERLRPLLEQNVAEALDDVEAISSYEVVGKELTKVTIPTDVWYAATREQRQTFVRDLQQAVTLAAGRAGYDMDLYSAIMVYDSVGNKIAEGSVDGKVTLYD